MRFSFNTDTDPNHSLFQSDYQSRMLDKFKETINDDRYGFFHLTDDNSHINETQKIFEKHKTKKYFVQIGIGGSALGPQMLIDALGNQNKTKFVWLDNTDSEYIADQLSQINLRQTLFYVVSKSGGTAETIAIFALCMNLLKDNGIEEKDFNQYFVFCTDPLKSDLRILADKYQFDSLSIPSNIGGRFSVLSPVGLLPALFADINIEDLYQGANAFKNQLLMPEYASNPLLKVAANLFYLYSEQNVNQTILMPYSSKLKSFSHWFVQLWAESLGKISSQNTSVGLTPIPAYGATDQHSQMQLFMEGPNDKFLFLVEIKNKNIDYELQNDIDTKSAKKLNGYTLNQLIEAQLYGTIKALKDRKRNLVHITIEQNCAKSMGEMVLFFESLTVLVGHYLFVDPFNQPGVELGKKYAFDYLKNLPK